MHDITLCGNHGSVVFETNGNLDDISMDLCVMLHTIYDMLNDEDPKEAATFKDFIKSMIDDDKTGVFTDKFFEPN